MDLAVIAGKVEGEATHLEELAQQIGSWPDETRVSLHIAAQNMRGWAGELRDQDKPEVGSQKPE